MASWKTERAITNFARFFNARLSYTDNGSAAVLWLPGLTYEHLDRSGRVDAWKITKLLEVARLIHINEEETFPMQKGSRPIMLEQQYKISPTFHKVASQHLPLVLKSAVTGYGKTSFTTTAKLIEAEEKGEVLAERKIRLVSVDTDTRKPTSLLDEFIAKHADYVAQCGEEEKYQSFDVPSLANAENVSTLEVTARHTDMDLMFHTNQGIYFKFSTDCACVAAEGRKYRQFDKDMCFYPIKQTQVLHKGESFPGDKLLVHSWEDPKLNMSLNFIITKQEKEIFYGRFQYYNENITE